MTVEAVETTIKRILIEKLNLNKTPEDIITTQEYFLENYGFNSVDALELLLHVENEFGIEIEDQDLNASLVHTIRALAEYVHRRVSTIGGR